MLRLGRRHRRRRDAVPVGGARAGLAADQVELCRRRRAQESAVVHHLQAAADGDVAGAVGGVGAGGDAAAAASVALRGAEDAAQAGQAGRELAPEFLLKKYKNITLLCVCF